MFVDDGEPVKPDYGGGCVANVLPALLGRADGAWLPAPVVGARVVVVLVLDGLGWGAREANPETLPELAGFVGGPITTVVPSTTAAALTSITTGLAPAEHGVVGFRVFVDGEVLNVLSWQRADNRRPPDAATVQRHPPFFGRTVPVVTESRFRTSGFTRVHLRDAPFHGWRVPSTLVEQCRGLARGDARVVYAYYPGLDEVAHEFGIHDGYYQAELAALDRLVGDLVRALPDDAALLVTADHGQIHVGPEGWLGLTALRGLTVAMSGDGRFRYLHARPGAAAELRGAAADLFDGRAWVFDRDQLLDEGWLGPVVSPAARRRVGDVILAAKGAVAFEDPAFPREAGLISAHGSLTPDEMWVPCLAQRGAA